MRMACTPDVNLKARRFGLQDSVRWLVEIAASQRERIHAMNRILIITAIVVGALASGPGFAEEAECNVPTTEWQPEEALRQKLEYAGWEIRRIKTDNGCYEVYGFDKDGHRMETYFDPKTLAAVDEGEGEDND
jgi:hypothetical protein